MMPKISIITPSFNRGWSIEACLKSVQNQNFLDYEHIVVDGGSCDDTLDIVTGYQEHDSRIILISEPDLGMYDAINKGLVIARGEIVAYLNTDDFYLPGALSRIVEEFDLIPSSDLIYGNWFSWYPEKGAVEFLPVGHFSFSDMAVFSTLPQPSVFFKRTVLNYCSHFDLAYRLVSDNDFFSRVMCSGLTSHSIDFYLSAQTVHSGNLLVGNESAHNEALRECENYRRQRQAELINCNNSVKNSIKLLLSKNRKFLFPFEWRFRLLIHLAKSIVFPRQISRFPWRFRFGRFSIKNLFYYSMPSFMRKIEPFYVVDSASFKAYLGFSPPDPKTEKKV
jgi:glycosyltransferase involved in cell wall biosynthesis